MIPANPHVGHHYVEKAEPFHHVVNWYAVGALVCCTILLAWWMYYHGRGPGIGALD